ncbi:hypothetical protein HAX54_031555 [Datura stramonium]|uniref:ATP synthase F1 complex delta/epsilon subunit N-terminal domain-containing protein n=1 Tax=Datura stramonium TaxID=4076 RepID=A0ABS8RGS1_DATST|nr:hypothetical protein [Datura stramonium]
MALVDLLASDFMGPKLQNNMRLQSWAYLAVLLGAGGIGQIGILPNHAPITITVDIGILRIRLKDQSLMMALMGGFARLGNNEITVLINNAEKDSDIDRQKARRTLEIARANMQKAEDDYDR